MIKLIKTKGREIELITKCKDEIWKETITLKANPMSGKWIASIDIEVEDMTEEELLRCCN